MKRIAYLAAAGALVATSGLGAYAANAATADSPSAQVRTAARHGADDPAGHHRHHGADDRPGHHRHHGAGDRTGHHGGATPEPGDDNGSPTNAPEPGDDHGGQGGGTDDGGQHGGDAGGHHGGSDD